MMQLSLFNEQDQFAFESLQNLKDMGQKGNLQYTTGKGDDRRIYHLKPNDDVVVTTKAGTLYIGRLS